MLEVLDADLSRLLRQKYHVFWSHVIFDPRLLRLIDSFLRYARRAFDGSSPVLDSQSTYFSVFAKVFKGNTLLPAAELHTWNLTRVVLVCVCVPCVCVVCVSCVCVCVCVSCVVCVRVPGFSVAPHVDQPGVGDGLYGRAVLCRSGLRQVDL